MDKGDLEDVLTEDLRRRAAPEVQTSMELLSYAYGDRHSLLTAHVKNHVTGAIESWHTGYILGCDGAESKVREAAGIMMESFGSLDFWADAKVTAETDMPDIRRRCTIKSPHGNCVLTPCKDDAIRIMTLLSSEDPGNPNWNPSYIASNTSTSDHAASSMGLAQAQALRRRISASIAPYTLQITNVLWINQYSRRKALAERFSDPLRRVFLLGSAAHAHSALTKQGINGGVADASNLAWKLALVLRGAAPQSLLRSYQFERRSLLAGALEFDGQVDRIFALGSEDAAARAGFWNFEEASGYTSGCGARYPASYLVKEEKRVHLKEAQETLTPGKRLLPLMLTRHIDGNEIDSLDVIRFDGRFHLLLLVGDLITAPIVQGLANFLASTESPLTCFNNPLESGSKFLNIVLVHTSSHYAVPISNLPQPFPQYPWNIFEDVGGKSHVSVGVSPKLGALCLLRPDGYVGMVSNLDDGLGVRDYMAGILVNRGTNFSKAKTMVDGAESMISWGRAWHGFRNLWG